MRPRRRGQIHAAGRARADLSGRGLAAGRSGGSGWSSHWGIMCGLPGGSSGCGRVVVDAARRRTSARPPADCKRPAGCRRISADAARPPTDQGAEEAEGKKMPAASDGEHVERCESDSKSFLLCAKRLKQQRDAYQDFMPMFQQLCKSTSAPGELGEKCHEIMNKGLKRVR